MIFFLLVPKKKKKIDCGYTLEPPGRGGSNEYLYHLTDRYVFICVIIYNITPVQYIKIFSAVEIDFFIGKI